MIPDPLIAFAQEMQAQPPRHNHHPAARQATVIMVANSKVMRKLLNSLMHYAAFPGGGPPIEPQCLDDETFVNCSAFASAARPYARIRCVRADCCNASDGRLLEQLLNYKWVAASRHIARTGGAAIVLDVDALVLSQACLDEWTSYPEPFVSQIGGAPGCPPTTTTGWASA